MSKAEILEELPRLTDEDRAEVREELQRIEGTGPTPEEIALLDKAQADFDADQDVGITWEELEARLRAET